MTAPNPEGDVRAFLEQVKAAANGSLILADDADVLDLLAERADTLLAALQPSPAAPSDVTAFAPKFYQALIDHAVTALRERKPFQINADGAYSLITQAAEDRATVAALPPVSGGGLGEPVAWRLEAIKRGLHRWLEWDFADAPVEYNDGAQHIEKAIYDAEQIAMAGEKPAYWRWQDSGIEFAVKADQPHPHYAQPLYARQQAAPGRDRPDKYANDEAAKQIYDAWSDMKGWVPWVERGNSDRQEQARRLAAPGRGRGE